MHDAEREILQSEVARGDRAKRAMAEFFQPFIDANQKILFQAFISSDEMDKDKLLELKRMSNVLSKFQEGMEEYMTTGKMATLSLNQEEENARN